MSFPVDNVNAIAHHVDSGGSRLQWSRAHEILDDMKKKRVSLVSEHSPKKHDLQQQHPGSPSATKLGTLHEYETTETDRAREILDRMKKQRESFSKLLVGSNSPTPTRQSLTRTESTAALSWVSSSSEDEDEPETYVFSEEEASNDYDDYCFRGSDVDSCSSSGYYPTSSSSSAVTFYCDGSSNSGSSTMLSSSSLSPSIVEALSDMRCLDVSFIDIPHHLSSVSDTKALSIPEHTKVMRRRSSETSRARSLYREESQSHRYIKREQTAGSATSRLRADLAAISERRSALLNMLSALQESESEDIDFSVVASKILSNSASAPHDHQVKTGRPPRPAILKTGIERARSKAGAPTQQPKRASNDKNPRDRVEIPSSAVPRLATQGIQHPCKDCADSIGVVELNEGLEGLVKDESVRESLFMSESSRSSVDDLVPSYVEFKVKQPRLSSPETRPYHEQPKSLRNAEFLKALYSPRPEETYQAVQTKRFGGLYHIAQRTDDVEKLTDRSHIGLGKKRHWPVGIHDDYRLPYNVEDRFCGGLYHIASQTRPLPSKMGTF